MAPRTPLTAPEQDLTQLSDEELQALIEQLGVIGSGGNPQSPGVDLSVLDAGTGGGALSQLDDGTGGLGDIFAQQTQADADQQELENLIAMLGLDDQGGTPQVNAPDNLLNEMFRAEVDTRAPAPRFDPMNAGGMNVGQFAGAMLSPEYNQSRAQARLDTANSMYSRLNPTPSDRTLLDQAAKSKIIEKLMERLGLTEQAAPATPPAPVVNPMTPTRTPESVMQTGQNIQSQAQPEMYNPMDMQGIIRNRLMGAGR